MLKIACMIRHCIVLGCAEGGGMAATVAVTSLPACAKMLLHDMVIDRCICDYSCDEPYKTGMHDHIGSIVHVSWSDKSYCTKNTKMHLKLICNALFVHANCLPCIQRLLAWQHFHQFCPQDSPPACSSSLTAAVNLDTDQSGITQQGSSYVHAWHQAH